MRRQIERNQRFPDPLSLLTRINQTRWSEDLASAFETMYGDDIRRLVVLHLWKLGLVAFRFDPSVADRILRGRCLELFENTISDVWIALTRDLIRNYLHECDEQSPGALPFLKYLAGVIRNITIDNARNLGMLPRYSERSLLIQFCNAKGADTRKAHLARAMYHLQSRTERELLLHCNARVAEDAYLNLYRLVHHFFEQYVPQQCPLIKRLRGHSAIAVLVKRYMESEYQSGIHYRGNLTPWDGASMQRVLDRRQTDQTSNDEDFLDMLALRGSQVIT